MPLSETVRRIGAVVPSQNGEIKLKVGTVSGVILIAIVTGSAQVPAEGVKTYEPDAELLTKAGLQVPLIPFNEVVGSNGAVVPRQKFAIAENVGVKRGFTVIVKIVAEAHCPPFGVKL